MCLAAAPATSLSLSGMKLPSVSDTLGGAPRHKPGNIKRPGQDGLAQLHHHQWNLLPTRLPKCSGNADGSVGFAHFLSAATEQMLKV